MQLSETQREMICWLYKRYLRDPKQDFHRSADIMRDLGLSEDKEEDENQYIVDIDHLMDKQLVKPHHTQTGRKYPTFVKLTPKGRELARDLCEPTPPKRPLGFEL